MDTGKILEVTESLPKTLEVLKKKEEEAKKQFLDAKHLHKTVKSVSDVLKALRTNWNDSDPGKYSSNYFFFRNGKKMWARELLDDPKAAELKHRDRIGTIGEVDPVPCPECKLDGLKIGRYYQTYDGPSGDEWQLDIYAMCLDCMRLFQLAYKNSVMRFM